MIVLPIYFLLISFLFVFFGGSMIGALGTYLCLGVFFFCGWLCSLKILIDIVYSYDIVYFCLYKWLSFEDLVIGFNFYFDSLSCIMVFIVLTIAMCTTVFSFDYLYTDPHVVRFLSLISVFTFFMIILVTSDNLVLFFLGWEGIGICSFFLISFWYTRVRAVKSALLALLVNKFSDLFLMIGSCILLGSFGSLNFMFLNVLNFIQYNMVCGYFLYNIVCLLLVIAAVGKSAQFGLHLWLPEAMEGPTPVSSLIHAATMVTAGIFLLLKLSGLFVFCMTSYLFLIFFGGVTTFVGSSIGIFHSDLKKIIAYSTCSQLGYMFMVCGIGTFSFSFFHLFNHAFFKALLFLTAGYIIHAFADEQDIRTLSGGMTLVPFAYVSMLFASLSMMGFPFFSGAYSKETIINLFIKLNLFFSNNNLVVFVLVCQSFILYTIFFTLYYSIKIFYFVYLYPYMGNKYVIENFGLNNTKFTLASLTFLYLLAFVSGTIFIDYYNDNVDDFLFLINTRTHDLYFRCSSFKIHAFVLVFEFYHYLHFMTLILLGYLVFIQMLFLHICNLYYDWYFFFILMCVKQFLYSRLYFFSFFVTDIKQTFTFCFDFVSSILDKNILDFENLWNLSLRLLTFWIDGLLYLEYNKFASLFMAMFVMYIGLFMFNIFYIL